MISLMIFYPNNQFPIISWLLFDILRSSSNILPRVEGWDILDSRKGLFCSPPPGSTVSHQELVQLLLNASSQRSDAQEVPQSDSFWKDTRGEIDKARNENIP